jgi:large subunit ribosomal protein L3
MSKTIKGKKVKMSQIFQDDGKVVPVTIIKADTALDEELVDKDVVVTGKSKGKGFAGVMKKWGFKGGPATRGQSDKPRAAGSIGSQTPGRVYKGKKMAGRMGNQRVTIKGLKIVGLSKEDGEIMVSGSVPGARNSNLKVTVLE